MSDKKYIELVEKEGYQYVTRLIGKEGAVVIIPMIVFKNGDVKFQLILSERPTFDKPILEFPAGLLDDSTKSIEDMIHSELKEETGWTGDILKIYDPSPSSSGITDELLHIAIVRLIAKDKPSFVGDEKITILPLMSVDELLEYEFKNKDKIYISSRIITFLIGFSTARAMYVDE